MEWVTTKPIFTIDCILITGNKIRNKWEYSIYLVERIYSGYDWYWGWLTGDGEEYGDIEDLHAQKYLVLPQL